MAYTAPVKKDGFSFSNDSFYAEGSGYNSHRRAAVSELEALFHPKSSSSTIPLKDPPAHWYEAQLLHYGLAPSKTKSVAKMRLLDAVNKGDLAVPQKIIKLEAELKKEWNKNDRKTKQELKKSAEKPPAKEPAKQKGTKKKEEPKVAKKQTVARGKRKAEDDGDKTQAAPPSKKRAKPAASKPALSTPESSKKPTTSSKKAVGSQDVSSRPRQMARRAKPFVPTPRSAPQDISTSLPEESSKIPKGSCTARRGGGFTRGKLPPFSPPSDYGESDHDDDDDDQDEPDLMDYTYGNLNDEDDQYPYNSNVDDTNSDDNETGPYSDEASHENSSSSLGLINGKYLISCPSLQREWDLFEDHQFSIILTLENESLWGVYDFGMFSGVFYLPERPYKASKKALQFNWRGVENSEGVISYNDQHQTGWIKFLGQGKIEGMIDVYGDAKFEGIRISGQQTRSDRNANSIRYEWNSYTEEAYEAARVGRWR